jgi:hypothetical protein
VTRHSFCLLFAIFAAMSGALPQSSTLGHWASAFCTFAVVFWAYKAGSLK